MPSSSGVPLFDPQRILAATSLRRIEYREELGSTNDLALELARQVDTPLPLLVLTDRQTAGRGRGVRRWWSAAGALTCSVVIEVDPSLLPRQRAPLISLMTALAIADALQSPVPDAVIGLKWPNDVLINGRKVCGVLVESPPHPAGRFVIGLGLNVNNSSTQAPAELQPTLTSLRDAAQRDFDLQEVLIQVVQRLIEYLQLLTANGLDPPNLWSPRCVLTGRTVEVEMGRQRLAGVCQGIDRDGALLVRTSRGQERCCSGTVRLASPGTNR
jgi:BirA family transcriptional regulator, biotin operon repressor / biotin---[acetyl-CoA-carboxylase] ligase